ncbi:hypothetical protein HFP51_05870 [Parasphingopyxis sp. CP4]|uniref:hypothetical protein n=1 Tax=Parasphingopyxis sp. CP4 TaxID=2724527 RepID=UPI0015A4B942|nr:hypothetical protein [Parasphingopyxis sp. CP4]QLC21745.1 hypothetical protein HFP51_05870 [Parasphingopyxis sp. CP4]
MNNSHDSKFEISDVLEDTVRLFEDGWRVLLAVTGIAAIGYTLIEVSVDPDDIFSVQNLFGFVVLYLQIYAIVWMARRRGLLDNRSHDDGSPTIGAYFRVVGQSILASIAIIFGLALLVVPGIWLMTIWFVILPILLIENEPVMDCFGRSRELVTPNFWKVLVLLALWLGAYVGAAGALVFFAPFPEEYSFTANFPLNFLVQAVTTLGWVLALAAYIQLTNLADENSVEDVFA